MPCYRVGGSMAHFCSSRGKKAPAACIATWGNEACLAIAPFLCDWPLKDEKTCDRPLCERHANLVEVDRHYCQEHFDTWHAVQQDQEHAA